MRRYAGCSILGLGIFVLSNLVLAQQMVTDPWAVPITVSCGGSNNNLNFGTMAGATDGYDSGKDVLAPPPPPSVLYSYFEISGFFDKLSSDFRSNTQSPNTWTLKITGTGGAGGTITWNASAFPSGDIPGSLTIGGVNMLTQNSMPFRGDQTLTISYTAPYRSSPSVQITVTTSPIGLNIEVDGTSYISPRTFEWSVGSSHTISAPSPQSGGTGTQYIFMSWSDGGVQTHTYIVPGTKQTVTANFKTRYYLTVSSTHGAVSGTGWYDAGSVANFSVSPTTVSGGTGTQYVFTGWTGSGAGSYTGPNASSSVVMNNPIIETASWKTQYYLTTSENPDEGGDMTPAPPGAWYDSGRFVTVDATIAPGYEWAGWSGDLSGTTKPTTITMTGPKSVTANFGKVVQITINTDPSGRSIIVDGVTYTAPQTFTWVQNSQHTLSMSSPQSGGAGTQYVFTSWSDGGAQTHTYIVPSTNQTVTANFKTQYYLHVSSPHGNPQGSGWYDSGATANFSVTTPDAQGLTRYVFTNWTGDYSGTSSSGSITMNSPKTVTANWKTQYYLTTSENPDEGGNMTPAPPGGWYDQGAQVICTAFPNQDYVFGGWSGDLTGTQNPAILLMDSPKTVTANFTLLGKIRITSNPVGLKVEVDGVAYTTPQDFSWTPGSTHTIGVADTLQLGGVGIRHLFQNWSDGGARVHSITVDGISVYTANFKTQYYLTTSENPDEGGDMTPAPPGAWYDSGTVVTVDATVASGYQWAGWSGELSGTTKPTTIIMDAPKTVTANFLHQKFRLTVSVDPPGSGAVEIQPAKSEYTLGEIVKLILHPSFGYESYGWIVNGAIYPPQNMLTLVINQDKNVIAKCKAIRDEIESSPHGVTLQEYSLSQNYPNPFNPSTTIGFQLPKTTHVVLEVYNTSGEQIRKLVDEVKPAGVYEVVWDGKDDLGNSVGSGIYYYRIWTKDFSKVMKMIYMK